MNKQINENEVFQFPEHIVPHGNRKAITNWCDRWGLSADKLSLYYDVKENRAVFPIVQNNKIVDGAGRSLGKKLPKWKRYGKNNLPYSQGHGTTAIVVEDCVSAAVVASDTRKGIAVLGTSLSESHKQYLSQFSTAIIALDPDALDKIMQFAKELRNYVKNVKVLRLKDDLKYRNEEDLNNLYFLTPKE
jgi:DNA primase